MKRLTQAGRFVVLEWVRRRTLGTRAEAKRETIERVCGNVVDNIGVVDGFERFMTFAWYGHLKFKTSALWAAIFVSWLIALWSTAPSAGQPIGHNCGISTAQLKTAQEVITLSVFCVFSLWYLKEPLKWNYLIGFVLVCMGALFVFAP